MWKCNVCNKENNDDRDRCWSCSTARGASQSQTMGTNQQPEGHVPPPTTNEHEVDTQATQTEVRDGISTEKQQEEQTTDTSWIPYVCAGLCVILALIFLGGGFIGGAVGAGIGFLIGTVIEKMVSKK